MATKYLHIGKGEKRISVTLMGNQLQIDEVASVLEDAYQTVEVHTRLNEKPARFPRRDFDPDDN